MCSSDLGNEMPKGANSRQNGRTQRRSESANDNPGNNAKDQASCLLATF
jgi:hypothetical protein